DAEAPYRLEFFGDDIESIRQFSPQTQRSLTDLKAVEVTATSSEARRPEGGEGGKGDGRPPTETGHLCDYLRPDAWTVLVEPDDLHEQGKHYLERVADVRGLFSV